MHRRVRLVGILVLLLGVLGMGAWVYWPFFSGLYGAEKIESGLSKTLVRNPSTAGYAKVLEALVTPEGRVAYQKMTPALQEELDRFLEGIATATPRKFPSDDHRLAFYLNAYNALVLASVLKRMPLTSVKDVGFLNRFFRMRAHTVGGVRVSLHGFETKIIRKYNPLLHFGLNCASLGCPPLLGEPYQPETLQRQLEAAATQFLADPRYNEFDATSSTLRLSPIFKWYRDDFGGDQGIRDLLARYGPAHWPRNAPITYLPYDWDLNAAHPN